MGERACDWTMGLDFLFMMIGMAVLLYFPAILLMIAGYLDKKLEIEKARSSTETDRS